MKNVTEIEVPEQGEVVSDLRGLFRGAVQVVLEQVLEAEMRELIGAGRYERLGARIDHRNGSYLRRLVTTFGAVDVKVPRSRAHGAVGEALGRYQRRVDEIDDAIVESYVSGVSTRNMSRVTRSLLGEDVTRSTVSRVTKSLEAEVEALRTARIGEPMAYLYLDGTFLDARWARKVENVAALVAYGVAPDGKRRLLGVSVGPREAEDTWGELLDQLIARGLRGVRLVISDDHAGLRAALRTRLPEVPVQRCVVHLERNVLAKVPSRLQKRMGREVSHIFAAPSLVEAKRRLALLQAGLGKQLPEATDILARGFTDATRFYAFPEAHWLRIRSTNGLERLHGEIKRRIRAVGAFPDRASALRLITAVALRVTNVWSDRRYLDMSLLDANDERQEAVA